jgi:hypothetical protein
MDDIKINYSLDEMKYPKSEINSTNRFDKVIEIFKSKGYEFNDFITKRYKEDVKNAIQSFKEFTELGQHYDLKKNLDYLQTSKSSKIVAQGHFTKLYKGEIITFSVGQGKYLMCGEHWGKYNKLMSNYEMASFTRFKQMDEPYGYVKVEKMSDLIDKIEKRLMKQIDKHINKV